MENWKEYGAVCAIGSVGYSALEVLWRGFTHWTMAVAGGVGYLLLYKNDLRMRGQTLVRRCAAGCALLTAVEFVSGCLVNLVGRKKVWDYSHLPGNLLGQVCPLYTALWFLLCVPVLPLSGFLHGRLGRPGAVSREIPA